MISLLSTNRFKTSASLILMAAFSLTSCGRPLYTAQNTASTKTVAVPHTGVQDQGRFGICWAYGTVGLIESEFKKRTGEAVDISEEAIAFHHMAEGIKLMFETMPLIELLSVISRGNLPEGWNTRVPDDLEIVAGPGQTTQHDALDLVKIFGAVPESAWSFKVANPEDKAKLFAGILKNLSRYITGKTLKSITLEEIVDNILVGGNAYPSKPPTEFSYAGKTHTAVGFLNDYLQFNPDAFEAVAAASETDYDKVISATKQALGRGLTVPFAFPINVDRIKKDLFTGADILDKKDWYSFARDGGHLVLVTDFVNVGGKEGAVDAPTLKNELEKPASDLDYLVIKNSWGIGAKYNEAGKLVGDAPSGYYKMDQSFVRGSTRVPTNTGNKWNTIIVVVPKDIADSLNKPN